MGRYFLRFEHEGDRHAAAGWLSPISSEESRPYLPARDEHLMIADLGPEEVHSAHESGVQVYEDVLFQPLPNPIQPSRLGDNWEYWSESYAMSLGVRQTQDDVMRHINAPTAWETSTGEGVTIAIVDTGISGLHNEFPAWKRSPHSVSPSFADPWSDPRGHGSMCASAAAATTSDGGRWNGVAPGATLLSARTTLFSTDIYKIYDMLLDHLDEGRIEGRLVISNSYGLYTCSAPAGLQEDHPYLGIVREAAASGVPVVFAAGNNHWDVLCNHDPAACEPNTIWGVNSVDEVITVGTVNQNNSNQQETIHANSSRGPGQWSYRGKPDVVAPTYGETIWGDGYQMMEWWGTSGACPQVAGLAALLLSADDSLSPEMVLDIIQTSSQPLDASPTCVGAGVIDCAAALTELSRRS